MTKREKHYQPIDKVLWIDRAELKANAYNPNKVAPTELELLVQSILTCGWTQPVVIRANREIVDGYHRYIVSGDERILAITGGKVPCVVLREDMDMAEQMSATITHNRAGGTHYVVDMANIVQALKADGKKDEWIARHLGMEQEEISRLASNLTSPETKGQDEFGTGWEPEYGG